MGTEESPSELQVHLQMLKDNKTELIIICAFSFALFWLLAVIQFIFVGKYTKWLVARNPNSSAKFYLESTRDKKWNYIQCYQSTILAIATSILCWITIVKCDPPED